jgi:protein gp37
VHFFFKQWGGWGADGKKRSKKENGRILKGRTWDAMPDLMYNRHSIEGITIQVNG